MSENRTEIIRRDIMMEYLRTLVWIDDEIRPSEVDLLGEPFRNFFYPIAREFQKMKLLVHLHPYDSDTSSVEDTMFDEESESFKSAVILAKKADVIIVDWHLGRSDPKQTIQLLKELRSESAIRYIIVLSQFDDDFEKDMSNDQMLLTSAPDKSNSHLFRNIGDAWANNQGSHIIVMRKPDLSSLSPEIFTQSVLEAIFKLKLKANPDYLHWAAIEIAAKLRHAIPSWVAAIPSGTDAALLSELHAAKTEARIFVPEHLLENLSHVARLHRLTTLDSCNCLPLDWLNRSYVLEKTSVNSERFKKFVHFTYFSSDIDKKSIDKIRENAATDTATKSFMVSQNSFTEFCEIISLSHELTPTFGSIYVQDQKGEHSVSDDADSPSNMNSIYVCVSQECDAARENSLMLIVGSVSNGTSQKDGITRLSLLGKIFGFLPSADSLRPVTVVGEGNDRRIDSYKKIGQLRKATARRIINRYWSHFSRSAVNLPRFTLKDRNGE